MLALLAAAFTVAFAVVGSSPDRSGPGPEAAVRAAYGKLPLRFEPNRGQAAGRVRFLSRGAGYSLFLTEREAVLSLKKGGAGSSGSPSAKGAEARESTTATLRIRPLGADQTARLAATEPQRGHSNYLSGSDRSRWRTGVPGYGRVTYRDVYPGIDLVYRGAKGKLEYDFVLSPGADPNRIALAMKGARRLSLTPGGHLLLHTGAGTVRQQRPFVFQRVGKAKVRVDGRYVLEGKDRVGFSLGAYDRSRPLVIDPVLAYSSFLGGSGSNSGQGIAVDAAGNAYVTGYTTSTSFPTASPRQPATGGGTDAFVTKLDPSGSTLVYSTYLGGSATDYGNDIATDSGGNAYLVGETTSTDFPTQAPFQSANGKNPLASTASDAFVAKLNPLGSALVYSTYLGGLANDYGYGIAVSGSNAYVTGYTLSQNFPTTLQSVRPFVTGSAGDAFVTRFSDSGATLAYSTYLGGSSSDQGRDIAVDASGNAYVSGHTASNDFPAPVPANGAQTTYGGSTDAFLAKLNASGSALTYSSYLGGSSDDQGYAIALDSAGAAYVTGETRSANFPTKNAAQATGGPTTGTAAGDVFVTKLDPGASGAASLAYSTYVSGSDKDFGEGVGVDGAGSAYVTGYTESVNFPVENAVQPAFGGPESGAPTVSGDAFVTKLNPAGSAFSYSTYLGGNRNDHGHAIAVNAGGDAYLTGFTSSLDLAAFPTTEGAYQRSGAGQVAFITKVSRAANLSITLTDAPDPVQVGRPLTYTVRARNAGPDTATGVSIRDELPGGVVFDSATDCSEAAGVVTCAMGDLASGAAAERQITVRPSEPNAALQNTATVKSSILDPVSANDSATETTEVLPAQTTSADLSISKTDGPDPVQTGEPLTYTVIVRSAAGSDTAQAVSLRDPLPDGVAFISASAGCTVSPAKVVTCTIGELEGGASAERQIVVRPALANPALSNTATVQSATGDPDSANNAATARTEVRAVADLSVTKSDSPDPVHANQDLTYTLGAHNVGPDAAQGVTVRDELPSGVSFRSASAGCAHAAGVVTCQLGELASGSGSAPRQIVVRASQENSALSNTATVQSPTDDPRSANNSATATTEVLQPQSASANLALTMTDSPDPVFSGEQLTYTLRTQNAGPNPAEEVRLRDELPGGVAFVSASEGCTEAASVVTCDLGEIGTGEPALERQIVVRPTMANPALSNTATVQGATNDPATSNNAATSTTEVRPAADLSITKTDSPDPVEPGKQLTYALSVRNAGPDTAQGVTLTDQLPEGVTFVEASVGCSQAGGIVSCELDELPSGSRATPRQIVVRPTLPNPALSNTAVVQSSAADLQSADNSATATTAVRQAAGAPGKGGPSGDGGDKQAGREPAPAKPGACANKLRVKRRGGRAARRRVARLTGTPRGDALLGSSGKDVLRGMAGADCLHGRAGNDTLIGGRGDDSLTGGSGADKLDGGPGVDKFSGGRGADRVNTADGIAETVRCGPGRDRVKADRRDRLKGCERRSLVR